MSIFKSYIVSCMIKIIQLFVSRYCISLTLAVGVHYQYTIIHIISEYVGTYAHYIQDGIHIYQKLQ